MNNEKYVKIKKVEADKRLIKYFTSRLLFLLLALLFVWYGCSMYVHADDTQTVGDYFDIDNSKLNPDFVWNNGEKKSFFNSYDYNYCVTNYGDDYGVIDSNYHPTFASSDNLNGYLIDIYPDWPLNDYYIIIGPSNLGAQNMYFCFIPKYIIDDGIGCFTSQGFYSTENFEYKVCAKWGNTYYDINANQPKTFIADGSVKNIVWDQYWNSSLYGFTNIPIWDGSGFNNDLINSCNTVLSWKNNPSNFNENIFNVNYFYWNDISNMMDSFIPAAEVESNKNHLYFEDVQIGLTSQGGNMNILESSVVIGVEVDDWIKNHINDYWVYVSYRVHIKDSDLSVNDPNTVWAQYLPLRTFYNDAYTCGVSEIFQQAPVTGYTNFLNYYNHITSTHSIEVTNQNGIFNSQGIFPSIMRLIGFNIGDYKVTKDNISNYSIFDFGLEVRVVLTDNAQIGQSNTSGVYAKDFNFLNGTSSITKAEGLVNNNPWTGESEPQENPIVPSSGNGLNPSISGGGSSTNNIQVNSYSKVPMNVQSKQELDNALSRYTEVTQYFNNYFKELSEVQNDNSYLYFLGQTIPMIPGVNFMISSAMIVFALAVILFVLKVLLF